MPQPLSIQPHKRLRVRYRWSMGILGVFIGLLLLILYGGHVSMNNQARNLTLLSDYRGNWQRIGYLSSNLLHHSEPMITEDVVLELETLLLEVNREHAQLLTWMKEQENSLYQRALGLPKNPVDTLALNQQYRILRNHVQEVIAYYRFNQMNEATSKQNLPMSILFTLPATKSNSRLGPRTMPPAWKKWWPHSGI